MTAPVHTFAASELAAACGGRLVGDDRDLAGVRSLELAGPTDLSFVSDSKAERRALASRAGALLVRSASRMLAEGCAAQTFIEAKDPQLALVDVLRRFFPDRRLRPGVHATAIVGEGLKIDATAEIGPYAVLGKDVEIGAGVLIEAHVVIGDRCRIGPGARLHPHVVLYEGVVIGASSEVHSGAVLGADGFGYAPSPTGLRKIPQVGHVELGRDVEIGANSCVDRASLEVTRIGDGTKIDDLVMIGHNCEVGRHAVLCGQVGLAGSTTLGDGVVLAGQVGVSGHLRIGQGVKAGGRTGISEDIPDGATIFGDPFMRFRDSVRARVEYRRLPELARVVRLLAERAGIAMTTADEGRPPKGDEG